MKLEFYKPKNDLLKQYIEGYYFISQSEEPNLLNYWTFPNNFFILSVSQNVEVLFDKEKIIIKPSAEKNTIANFVSRYRKPIEVLFETDVNEITIYFKPLGINHFIGNTEFLFKHDGVDDFEPFVDFKTKMDEIFLVENREIQIELLESYWLSKFHPKPNSLKPEILKDVESELKIDQIARKHQFSRQHLNKLFLKNIGKSPSEYRKIHRFRNSILQQKASKNLTELSYDASFYDQSHLIKDFKELSNITPYSFFKKVDTEKENIWLFI